MSSAPRAFHIAMRNAKANLTPPPTGWTWKYDGRMYYIRKGPGTVGTVSFIPGAVDHESFLMDALIEHLTEDQPIT